MSESLTSKYLGEIIDTGFLRRGDVAMMPIGREGRYMVVLKCIDCAQVWRADDAHRLTVEDGRPTLTPSIVCPDPACNAHYWIETGTIRRA